MRDFCAELRLVLSDTLRGAGIEAAPETLRLCCADSEAAFALREDAAPPELPLCAHPWLARVELHGNRICFSLHEHFYREAAAHILGDKLPSLPPSVDGLVPYALARMRMLARKGGDALDDSCKAAFFSALYAAQADISQKERARRMEEAARRALLIGAGVPLEKRQAYFCTCGMAAACIARLLAYYDSDKEMK